MHIKTLRRNTDVSKTTTKEPVHGEKSNTTGQERSGRPRTPEGGHFSQSWFVATHRDRSNNEINRLSTGRCRYLGPFVSRRRVGSDAGRESSHEETVQSNQTKE